MLLALETLEHEREHAVPGVDAVAELEWQQRRAVGVKVLAAGEVAQDLQPSLRVLLALVRPERPDVLLYIPSGQGKGVQGLVGVVESEASDVLVGDSSHVVFGDPRIRVRSLLKQLRKMVFAAVGCRRSR